MNKAMEIEGKEEGETGYKYFTPVFRRIDNTTMNVQDLQLSADANDYDVNLQKLDFEGGGACYYYWLTKDSVITLIGAGEMDPLPDGWSWQGKNGCWATDSEESGLPMIPTEGSDLQDGETVQFDGFIGTVVNQSGSATDETIDYVLDYSEEPDAPETGYRYVGNGFAAPISIQDVQMNAEASDYDENIQFLDFEGGGACYYYWLTKDSVITLIDAGEMEALPDGWSWEGKNGCWATDNEDSGLPMIPTDSFATVPAGEGFQIDGFGDRTVSVLAPYEL